MWTCDLEDQLHNPFDRVNGGCEGKTRILAESCGCGVIGQCCLLDSGASDYTIMALGFYTAQQANRGFSILVN